MAGSDSPQAKLKTHDLSRIEPSHLANRDLVLALVARLVSELVLDKDAGTFLGMN